MKLFIIYSDLATHEAEWKEALSYLVVDNKAQVCLVTGNVEVTKARLLKMGDLGAVYCLEVKENACHENQIVAAQKMTNNTDGSLIIALSDSKKVIGFQRTMPDADIIEINLELGVEQAGFFRKLKKLSIMKRSELAEFNDIRSLIESTNYESKQSWPVTPKENLEAQKKFLGSVLKYANKCPDKSKAQCILQAKADDELKGVLADVLYAPPNVTGLRWKMFGASTPMMKLIEEAEQKVIAEAAKEVAAEKEQIQTTPGEREPLINSPQRSYGSIAR